MNAARQRGQSMTEYLVVLGVTGLALLATTTDVGELFDNVHRSYATQSNEMNRVQLYNSQKVRFNENPPGNGDFDDGDTPPPPDDDLPEADEQLPYIEWVYDKDGTLLGQMKGDNLLDSEGNIIAFCTRDPETGDCVFKDAAGNIIFIGATGQRLWVDEHDNELPLVALVSGGRVYGFAYQYKGKFYSARSRQLLNPQPTGFSAEPMRRIQDYDDQGVPQTAGYELGGAFYSHQATLQTSGFDTPVAADTDKELVNVIDPPATSQWQGYRPCLVMPRDWTSGLSSGSLHAPLVNPVWADKFNAPSIHLGSAGIGGFIDASASDCGGASSVTYDPLSQEWTLAK